MSRATALYVFWGISALPLVAFWLLARKRERRKEDWAVVAAFTISFLATGVQREMALGGLPNWIVPVIYPVPQVAVLAYGLMDRWPKWRPWITAMSFSVSGAVALVLAAKDVLPDHPEMTTLAAVSVIVFWLAWARKDLGLMRWALLIAFIATLPGVIAFGRASTPAEEWAAFLLFQVPFAIGALLTCFALWRGYRAPTDAKDADLPPPFGLRVLRSLWMSTGRA